MYFFNMLLFFFFNKLGGTGDIDASCAIVFGIGAIGNEVVGSGAAFGIGADILFQKEKNKLIEVDVMF